MALVTFRRALVEKSFVGRPNLSASTRAIGLRFIDFLDPRERLTPERWH